MKFRRAKIDAKFPNAKIAAKFCSVKTKAKFCTAKIAMKILWKLALRKSSKILQGLRNFVEGCEILVSLYFLLVELPSP